MMCGEGEGISCIPVELTGLRLSTRTVSKNCHRDLRGVSFLPGGGLPKIGGIRYFFLDQKGIKRFFSN